MNTIQERQNTPVVAIIMPLYNKGKYVARALNSIFAQTYQNFEIVVVDDGSTDRGADIVSSYTDSRMRLIRQANGGPGAARNRGIYESTAPLLSFLDADDEWLPEFLEKSVRRLQDHPECVLAVAGQYRSAERISWEPECLAIGITEGSWQMPTNMDASLLKLTLDFISNSGPIVGLRNVVERFGGFYTKNRCTYGEDLYLWLQVALNHKIYRDPAPLFWWHTEASEISAYSHRKVIPPWPMLTDPEPIRNNCPPEYRTLIERYFTYLALLAARRCIGAGDSATAQHLLRCYPVARTFGQDYARVQLDILLESSPRLRHWIRQARDLVRF